MTTPSDLLLQKVNALVKEGNFDQALSVARQRDAKAIVDASLHLEWANLLESLNSPEDVAMELHLAIRDAPENPEPYRRLAAVYQDQGQSEKAVHCWVSLIKRQPDVSANYKALGSIIEEMGAYEKALKLYQSALERTKDDSFRGLIRGLDFVGQTEPPETPAEAGDQLIPSQHHLIAFTTLFSGREGVYARQWASPTGETGYTPVHEPFTIKVAENHILGNLTAGMYPVRLDNTVNFIAFDLDMPKVIVNKTITRESLWKKAMEQVHRHACRLLDLAASADVPMYLEDSGFKGRHCWIFLETPVPAGVARKFGELMLSHLGHPGMDTSVELFPKQSRVPTGSLGNLIKLPLGFHRKTGRRGRFIGPDGEQIRGQLEFLDSVQKPSRRIIYGLIQKWSSPAKSLSVPDSMPIEDSPPPWEEQISPDIRHVQALSPQPVYSIDADIEMQVLLMKCPVIHAIADGIYRDGTVSNDAAQVIIHSIGHLQHGPEAVNTLFQRCLNPDQSMFMKSRLRGNPVSCPKIRLRVPQITSGVNCNCRFDPLVNTYPNPLIHVRSMPANRLTTAPSLSIDAIQFQRLLQEYLRLRQQSREITIMLSNCEKELQAIFENAGVESMNTAMGTLKRVESGNGRMSFTLELGDAPARTELPQIDHTGN
jgi:tetratricopeptide (TPR) repeat protein